MRRSAATAAGSVARTASSGGGTRSACDSCASRGARREVQRPQTFSSPPSPQLSRKPTLRLEVHCAKNLQNTQTLQKKQNTPGSCHATQSPRPRPRPQLIHTRTGADCATRAGCPTYPERMAHRSGYTLATPQAALGAVYHSLECPQYKYNHPESSKNMVEKTIPQQVWSGANCGYHTPHAQVLD